MIWNWRKTDFKRNLKSFPEVGLSPRAFNQNHFCAVIFSISLSLTDDRKEAQHISLWKASEAFTLKVSFCSLHRLETKFTLRVIYHLTKVLSLGWFTVSVWVCINQLQLGHCQKNYIFNLFWRVILNLRSSKSIDCFFSVDICCTVTKSADFGFIPLLWRPQVPQGCLDKLNHSIKWNLVLWCAKIGPKT